VLIINQTTVKTQEEKSQMVKNILNSVAELVKVKKIKGLAEFLGETESRLYGYIRNGNIVETGSFLIKIPTINVDWLRTGEGPMLLADKITANQEQHCPPGSMQAKAIPPQQNLDGWLSAEEAQKMRDMVKIQGKMIAFLEKENSRLEKEVSALRQSQAADLTKKNAQM